MEEFEIFLFSCVRGLSQEIKVSRIIVAKTVRFFIFPFFFKIGANDRAYEHWRIVGVSLSYFYKVKAGEKPANCESAAIVS